jgi:DNA replication protein DnaC
MLTNFNDMHTDDKNIISPKFKILKKMGACPTHGSIQGFINPMDNSFVCPLCIDDKQKEERLQNAINIFEARIKNSSIPKRYLMTRFDTFGDEARRVCVKEVKKWGDSLKKEHWANLMIQGGIGAGKTLISCRLSYMMMQIGWSVKYISSYNLCDDIKATYGKQDVDNILYNMIHKFDLIVLDEIDTILSSDHDKSIIHKIIRGRYDNMLPMVTISNNKDNKIVDKIGDRAFSALAENQTILDMPFKDFRRSKVKK